MDAYDARVQIYRSVLMQMLKPLLLFYYYYIVYCIPLLTECYLK